MFRSIVAFVCLLPSLSLFASEEQKVAYPFFDYQVARDHEIKPHRRAIPLDGMGQEYTWSHPLHIWLTVSPTGDVTHAEASGEDGDTRFWPQLESEVYRWKFTPFEASGKPVMATVEEYIDLVPPERLPNTLIPPPVITKGSNVTITLLLLLRLGLENHLPGHSGKPALESIGDNRAMRSSNFIYQKQINHILAI